MSNTESTFITLAKRCAGKLAALAGHTSPRRLSVNDRMMASPEFMAGLRAGIEDYKAGRVYKLSDLQREERDA